MSTPAAVAIAAMKKAGLTTMTISPREMQTWGKVELCITPDAATGAVVVEIRKAPVTIDVAPISVTYSEKGTKR